MRMHSFQRNDDRVKMDIRHGDAQEKGFQCSTFVGILCKHIEFGVLHWGIGHHCIGALEHWSHWSITHPCRATNVAKKMSPTPLPPVVPAVAYFFQAGVPFSLENAKGTAFSKVHADNINTNPHIL